MLLTYFVMTKFFHNLSQISRIFLPQSASTAICITSTSERRGPCRFRGAVGLWAILESALYEVSKRAAGAHFSVAKTREMCSVKGRVCISCALESQATWCANIRHIMFGNLSFFFFQRNSSLIHNFIEIFGYNLLDVCLMNSCNVPTVGASCYLGPKSEIYRLSPLRRTFPRGFPTKNCSRSSLRNFGERTLFQNRPNSAAKTTPPNSWHFFFQVDVFFVNSKLFSDRSRAAHFKTGLQNSDEFSDFGGPAAKQKLPKFSYMACFSALPDYRRLLFARCAPQLKFSEESCEFRIPIRQNHKVCSKLYFNPCFLGVFPPGEQWTFVSSDGTCCQMSVTPPEVFRIFSRNFLNLTSV